MASLNGSCCRAWMAGITVEVPILCDVVHLSDVIWLLFGLC